MPSPKIELAPCLAISSGRLFCVSTVSNVCAIKGPSPSPGRRPAPYPLSLTRLTVLTVLWDRFSPRGLIVRVPNRPLAAEDNLNP